MKKNTIEFAEKIEKVDLYSIFIDMENDLSEQNDYNWQFSFGSDKDILETINNLIKEADFYDIETISDYGFYWCGVLTREPWCDLNMEEEEILNTILHENIFIENKDHGYQFAFKNPSNCKLYRFFLKYRDGYGGNMVASIDTMLYKFTEWMKKELRNNLDKYGTWEEIVPEEEEELV